MQVNNVLSRAHFLLFLCRNNMDYHIRLTTKEKNDSSLAIFSSDVSLKLLSGKKSNC